jgi:hypothetical protein
MTIHSFKNGISITLPDDIPKEDLEKRWIETTMAMSLILYYPSPEQKNKPLSFKKPKTKIVQKRKNSWKSPKSSQVLE